MTIQELQDRLETYKATFGESEEVFMWIHGPDTEGKVESLMMMKDGLFLVGAPTK